MRLGRLAAVAALAAVLAGCGGSDDDEPAAEPSLERVRELLRATSGVSACGRFEETEQRNSDRPHPQTGAEPGQVEEGRTFLCGDTPIASYAEHESTGERDKGIEFARLLEFGEPYFVNGNVLVYVITLDPSVPTETKRSLPGLAERIRQDCSCGEVRRPPRRESP